MIHMPIWMVFAIISIGILVFAFTRKSNDGMYFPDLFTPLIKIIVLLFVVCFWCAWFLRGCIK